MRLSIRSWSISRKKVPAIDNCTSFRVVAEALSVCVGERASPWFASVHTHTSSNEISNIIFMKCDCVYGVCSILMSASQTHSFSIFCVPNKNEHNKNSGQIHRIQSESTVSNTKKPYLLHCVTATTTTNNMKK